MKNTTRVKRDIVGPVSNILYKITLYTTVKLSEKCTKVKKKENGPEFVYIKEKTTKQ